MLKERIKIEVKQEHIDNGKKCEAEYCAISLAIKDILTEYDVSVGCENVTLYKDNYIVQRYTLDNKGRRIVKEFDGGEEVFPTTIEINSLY